MRSNLISLVVVLVLALPTVSRCSSDDPDDRISPVQYQVSNVVEDPNECHIDVAGLSGTTISGEVRQPSAPEPGTAEIYYTLDGLVLGDRALTGAFSGDDIDLGGLETYEVDFAPDFDCVRKEQYSYRSSGDYSVESVDLIIDITWSAGAGAECAAAHSVTLPCHTSVRLELD